MQDYNFWNVNWGPDEAKGDNHLRDYFVDIPEYAEILSGKKRYIIGRKGTGKTAILERIRLNQEENPLLFTRTLSLRNFPLQTVRDLRDKAFRDKSQYVPVWKFLLVNAFVDMVLNDQGAGPREVLDGLYEFKRANFNHNYGFVETVATLSEQEAKLTVQGSFLSFLKGEKQSTSRTTQVHYSKVTDIVIEHLKNIKTDSTYYLLLDELDEGYRAGDVNLRLILLALLRAMEDVALEFSTVTDRFRPIAVLRSDIFDRLEDNDLNKLDDYTVRLRWQLAMEGTYTLRDVVNARIAASIGAPERGDLWPSLVFDTDPRLPPKVDSVWSYVANRTMERPRDIIKYLKYCQKAAPKNVGKLDYKTVVVAENQYSDWLYNEIRDEIHSHLPVWRESLQAISRIGQGNFKRELLIKELLADTVIKKWLQESSIEPDNIISLLFDFGILGNVKNRRWIFKYKDDSLSSDPSASLIVHYGFDQKLRLRNWNNIKSAGNRSARQINPSEGQQANRPNDPGGGKQANLNSRNEGQQINPGGGQQANRPNNPSQGQQANRPNHPSGGQRANPSEGQQANRPNNPGRGQRANRPNNPSQGQQANRPNNPSQGQQANRPNNPGRGQQSSRPKNPGGGQQSNPSEGQQSNRPNNPGGGQQSNPSEGQQSNRPNNPGGGQQSNRPKNPGGGQHANPGGKSRSQT